MADVAIGGPSIIDLMKKRFKLGFYGGAAFALPYCGYKGYSKFGYRGGVLAKSVGLITFGVAFNAGASLAVLTAVFTE